MYTKTKKNLIPTFIGINNSIITIKNKNKKSGRKTIIEKLLEKVSDIANINKDSRKTQQVL